MADKRIKMVVPIEGRLRGVVRITIDEESWHYWIRRMPCVYGQAFQIENFGGNTYEVVVSVEAITDCCNCKGFLYHLHCKHVDGLRALVTKRGLKEVHYEA